MTVVLDGRSLTVDEVVRVARRGETTEISPDAVERMSAARAVVERAVEREDRVYGLTTGVGVRKRVRVATEDMDEFNRKLILNHLTASGPDAPPEIVRATMLRLANAFSLGVSGVRPELAKRIVNALNAGDLPRVRMLGSLGQADLASMGDLARGLMGDEAPAAKEGIALLNSNAFSTAIAALAVADARRLLLTLDTAGALDLEAFAANLSPLHERVADVRPYPGLRDALRRLRALLDGSGLWEEGAARNLQDPLVFRCLAQVQGAGLDALRHVESQLAIELNASQENPIVLVDEDRLVSVANFDILPLAAALDYLRIMLASVLTAANERMVKLLEYPISDLPEGLAVERGLAEDSLAEFGVVGQAIVAEARLLAPPVSYEVASTSHAEGIEDRMTMAPLAARRLAEQVELGERIATIELLVAAQAVDLREGARLGAGTSRAHRFVRARIPFSGRGDAVPADLEDLRAAVRDGLFARLP